jgi:DNA polymerase I-like protein with 3'-5' exonuclease and polymerase domains
MAKRAAALDTREQPMLMNMVEAFRECQEYTPATVQTEEDLRAMVRSLAGYTHIAIDTETTRLPDFPYVYVKKPGLHRKLHRIAGISLCPIPEKYIPYLYREADRELLREILLELRRECYYVPLVALPLDYTLPLETVKEQLAELFLDREKVWWYLNWQFDIGVFAHAGMPILGKWHCLKIMHWLHDPRTDIKHGKENGLTHALKPRFKFDCYPLFRPEDGIEVQTFAEATGPEKDISKIDVTRASQYARDDAWMTACEAFTRAPEFIIKGSKGEELYNFERRKARCAARMESRGIAVDQDWFQEMRGPAERERKRLAERLYALFGSTEVNLNSPQEVGYWLFEKYGLPRKYLPRRATTYKVNKAIMLPAARDGWEICEVYNQYNKVNQMLKTFLIPLTSPDIVVNGRIYPRFNPQGTESGRWSSNGPNFQNMPRGEIRKGFIAPPGRVLIDADLSQIELRVMAHYSGDPMLVDAYMHDADIHSRTAALVVSQASGNPITEADLVAIIAEIEALPKGAPLTQEMLQAKDMRQQAKPTNFGMIYGMSAPTLQANMANDYGVYVELPVVEALHETYLEQYCGVAAWHKMQQRFVEKYGYCTTLMGRKRPLPDIYSDDEHVRGGAIRQAYNTPIQGTAGEILSMNAIVMDAENAFLIGQVHDEVLLECDEDDVERLTARVREIMCATAKLSVPLKASVAYGSNWAEVH